MVDADYIDANLWMGSAPQVGPGLRTMGFGGLVLCAAEYQPPAQQFAGLPVGRYGFSDSLDVAHTDLAIAEAAADFAARLARTGRNVLITCMQGRNRSGLVTALALTQFGFSPVRAVRLVQRRRRSVHGRALANPAFVRYLLER